MSIASLQQRIAACSDRLTTSQKEMADYVIAHPLRVVSMPIKELSEQTGFSVASATRFAQALGYSGYPEFREALAQSLESLITPLLRRGTAQPATAARSAREMFMASISEDMANLQQTSNALDERTCEQAVALLSGARRVYVYGSGQSAHLAAMMCNDLNALGIDSPRVTDIGGGWSAASTFARAGKEDLAVVISFPRYARDAVLMARQLALHKVPLLVFTDGPKSPIAGLASVALYARSLRAQGKLSSKATELALMEALITALHARQPAGKQGLVRQVDFAHPWLHDADPAGASSSAPRAAVPKVPPA